MVVSPDICAKCRSPLEPGEWGRCSRCLAEALLHTSKWAETSMEEPIARLGNYELMEEIARGGMGVVFRARQTGLNREVAVKLLRESWLASEESIRRFRAEAEAAARLRHPNIVAIHEVGEQDRQHYFAMDLVDGVNLAQATADGPLPARRAAEIVRSVAEAVQYAHGAGLLHRDLKPSNVLLDAEGQPFVTDFGVARAFDLDSSLTVTGQIVGTPGYMAPEQATGRKVGPEADIYALGALLYHLVTARPPFTGGTAVETLQHVAGSEPVPPQLVNPGVPRDLASVCLKCLAKRPADRYAAAEQVVADLDRFLAGEPTRARPAGVAERAWRWCQRKPALAAALAFAALATVIGLAGIVWQWRRAEAERLRAQRNETTARQGLYAADMNLIQQTLAQHNLSGARLLLDAHRPQPGQSDLRGWEWWYFSSVCRGDELAAIRRDAACRAVVQAGAAGVIVGGADGKIELWDPATQQRRATLIEEKAGLDCLESDPAGQRLFTATPGGVAKVWELDSQFKATLLWQFESKSPFAAFSPVQPLLAISSRRNVMPYDDPQGDSGLTSVLNYRSQTEVQALDRSGEQACFSPDGRTLVTGSWKGALKVWDTLDWSLRGTIPNVGRILDLTIAPDNEQLAASNWAGDVLLIDLAQGKVIDSFKGHASRVWSVRFSPDGRWLATGSGDQTIALWEMTTRRERVRLKGHGTELRKVVFSHDGKFLASTALGSETLRFWKADPEIRREKRFELASPPVFSSDGLLMASGDMKGKLALWNIDRREKLHSLDASINPVAFIKTNSQLITAQIRRTLPLYPDALEGLDFWDVASGRHLRTQAFSPSNSVTSAFALSPDEKLLATGDTLTNVFLWNIETGQIVRHYSSPGIRTWIILFSSDGRKLAVGAAGEVNLWDLESGRLMAQFQASGLAVAFSPDDRVLAIGMYKEIRLFDTATGRRIDTLRGHREGLYWLSFSRDGRTLASACEDLKLWNLATGREVASFRQNSPFLYAHFTREGRHLIGARLGEGFIWSLDTPLNTPNSP